MRDPRDRREDWVPQVIRGVPQDPRVRRVQREVQRDRRDLREPKDRRDIREPQVPRVLQDRRETWVRPELQEELA